MTDFRDEVLRLAKERVDRGESLQRTVEAVADAMIRLVPEDHQQRNIILEGPYAELAKKRNRIETGSAVS